MSYLKKLKVLLHARKAWRVFAAKIQTKLHKLNKAKGIKKPKTNHLRKTATTNNKFRPGLSFQPRFKRRGRIIKPSHTVRYHAQKRAKPVYVDQLFLEPVADRSSIAAGKWSPSVKSGPGEGEEKNHGSADDMWESLALASPQMRGINERAEEFIMRFRADLHAQEIMARRL